MQPDSGDTRACGGFGLIEVLAVLLITAILVTWAVPSFRSAINRARVISNADRFVAALDGARSYAIRDDARVRLCPSVDGLRCAVHAGLGVGWIIVSESGGKPALIHAWAAPSGRVTAQFGAAMKSLDYGANGLPLLGSGALPMGHVNFCSGHQVRQIVLNATGRARVAIPAGACDDCSC